MTRTAEHAGRGTAVPCALVLAAVVLAAAGPQPATAKTLRLAVSDAPSALDPHFENRSANRQVAAHLFDALVRLDATLRPQPSLAESWRAVDDYRWRFTLRRDVTFHDGTPFTAGDVIFSIDRVRQLVDSPRSFAPFVRDIAEVTAPDPHTLEIVTAKPVPLLPYHLSQVAVLSRAAAAGKTTQDLNAGIGLVGTGPYRLVGWANQSKVVLRAYPAYWGGAPIWDEVVLYPFPQPSARLAVLRSGLVGVIERPALDVLSQLTNDQEARVDSGESTRLVFLQMDQVQVPSPKVSNSGGKNPFQDARVRRAVSLAIDRAALVGETLAGQGVPAGQFMGPAMQGHLPELSPPRADRALAKRLLAEAGYPDGFAVVLSLPEERIDGGALVAAALAEDLTAVGITTTVEPLSRGLFYSLRNRQAFSLYLDMLDNPTGDVAFALEALVASRNPAQGSGFANHSGYANAELDLMLGEAARTIDPERRQAVLAQAVHAALADQALVPLYFESVRWGVHSSLRALPRADGMALADSFRPTAGGE